VLTMLTLRKLFIAASAWVRVLVVMPTPFFIGVLSPKQKNKKHTRVKPMDKDQLINEVVQKCMADSKFMWRHFCVDDQDLLGSAIYDMVKATKKKELQEMLGDAK